MWCVRKKRRPYTTELGANMIGGRREKKKGGVRRGKRGRKDDAWAWLSDSPHDVAEKKRWICVQAST